MRPPFGKPINHETDARKQHQRDAQPLAEVPTAATPRAKPVGPSVNNHALKTRLRSPTGNMNTRASIFSPWK